MRSKAAAQGMKPQDIADIVLKYADFCRRERDDKELSRMVTIDAAMPAEEITPEELETLKYAYKLGLNYVCRVRDDALYFSPQPPRAEDFEGISIRTASRAQDYSMFPFIPTAFTDLNQACYYLVDVLMKLPVYDPDKQEEEKDWETLYKRLIKLLEDKGEICNWCKHEDLPANGSPCDICTIARHFEPRGE